MRTNPVHCEYEAINHRIVGHCHEAEVTVGPYCSREQVEDELHRKVKRKLALDDEICFIDAPTVYPLVVPGVQSTE